MITLKQLEALFWVARLGTFNHAAARLNTTQSAISKRIQELEAATQAQLLNRRKRGTQLTQKGGAILKLAKEMLEMQARVEKINSAHLVPTEKIRIGITELSAVTWFPKFLSHLHVAYPTLKLEPSVEATRALQDRLRDEIYDVIVAPELDQTSDFISVSVGEAENAWMVKPNQFRIAERIPLQQLADYPLLLQGRNSGTGAFYNRWLRKEGLKAEGPMSSDNFFVLIGFTVAGIGISYLPVASCQALLDDGRLTIIRTDPPLPPVTYSVSCLATRHSVFMQSFMNLIAEQCDFSKPLQVL